MHIQYLCFLLLIGVVAGITAVCCLFLSLLFGAASVVATFLITRKYYSKKVTKVEGVGYASVQPAGADTLQLQPNPAYESLDTAN